MFCARIVFVLGLFVAVAHAQERIPLQSRPVFMTWHIMGLDSEMIARSRPSLHKVARNLAEFFFRGSVMPIVELPGLAELTINTRKSLSGVFVPQAQQDALASLQALQPVWCALGDRFVVGLLLWDRSEERWLAFEHQAVPRSEWLAALAGGEERLTRQLSGQMQSVLEKIIGRRQPERAHRLQLRLALSSETTRADQGSLHCAHLVLAQSLLQEFAVVPHLGTEEMGFLRQVLPVPGRSQRATRHLVFHWQVPKPFVFKGGIRAQVRVNEAVFGRHIRDLSNVEFYVESDQEGFKMGIPTATMDFLRQEAAVLATDVAPQVVHREGAWAYVDKGRAYGLRIRDRLVAVEAPSAIQGHVVRYFGGERQLRTKEGHLIQDGAIVYIRKGQRQVKKGLTFKYDSKTYPSFP